MKINELVNESKEAPKPRNFVAKNAKMGGAGAHKDKKKAEKQGDVKHKKQAVPMDEAKKKTLKNSNPCWKGYHPVGTKKKGGRTVPNCVPTEGVAEGIHNRDAYQRDYDSSISGFGNRRRDIDDEANLMYIYKDGRVKQRMISNHEERSAHQQGFRDSPEQALKIHGIIRSKFKPGKWVQKQGTQWVEVHPFGAPEVKESASIGATSSANVATVVNPDYAYSANKKPVKSVNALDQDEVSLFGAPMETYKGTTKKSAIIKRR